MPDKARIQGPSAVLLPPAIAEGKGVDGQPAAPKTTTTTGRAKATGEKVHGEGREAATAAEEDIFEELESADAAQERISALLEHLDLRGRVG